MKPLWQRSLRCTPGAPVDRTATAAPQDTTPFQPGDVEVRTTARAQDPNYGNTVTASTTAAVRLQQK